MSTENASRRILPSFQNLFSRPRFLGLALAAVFAATLPAPLALAQSTPKPSAADDLQAARALSRAFQRVAKQTEPAVVHLIAIRKVDEIQSDGWMSRRTGRKFNQPVGFGSGVLIDPTGILLTNNHVVEPGETFRAKLADGREFAAVVVGRDPFTDLAIVRISDAPAGEVFPTAPLGDSDSVEVGDWVIAIGSPFGFTSTVTTGIVSAKSRSGVNLPGASRDMAQDFIQTDAAINPGNSGGPLLDLEGKIVGINSAIATRAGGSEGIGFAIPAQIAKAVMDSIMKSGKVVRGYVGISFEELTAARLRQLGLKQESGLLVTKIEEKGPGAIAGLKPDDIIVKFNGRPMARESTLKAAIAVTSPGSRVAIELIRDGKNATVSVEVGDANAADARAIGGVYAEKFGGAVQTIDNAVRHQLGAGFGKVEGIVVRSVDPQGAAASSGFQPNDIIVAVDDTPVKSVQDFKEALDHANAKEPIRLGVIRNRMRGFIDLIQE